ncbi:hypothetical protein HPB52_006882 [Rhipicephalus sanguineus]|uniref:Uncharacterized protein n=1 Tax=Rhipicephalus sanguineus TaxID=34632 RepID=A0A9D4PD12_RHISA|nr:hypothetical protein HPB52_006882 [Rhipicephalus sanguineus]
MLVRRLPRTTIILDARRRVEWRPQSEEAYFNTSLQSLPADHSRRRIPPSRRVAAEYHSTPTRRIPEDYYQASRRVSAEHYPTSRTSAPANVSRELLVCYTCGLRDHMLRFCRRSAIPTRQCFFFLLLSAPRSNMK